MVEAGADVNGESGSADAKGVGDDATADEQKEMVAVAEDAGTTEGKQESAGAGVVEQQQQPFRPALPHLVLVLDPKRQVVASLNYPAACGFASHEILRLIDAMQNSYYNEVGSVAPSVKKRRLRPPYQPTRTTLRALPHSIVCRSTRR